MPNSHFIFQQAIQTFTEQENSHEMAIFGNMDSKSSESEKHKPDTYKLSKKSIRWEERDPKTLMHESVSVD